MDPTAFAYALGITLRLTHLIATDTITEPARKAIAHRYGTDSMVAQGIECPWCVSVWIAPPTAVIAYYASNRPTFITIGVAAWCSYLTGIAATWIEGD